MHAKIAVTQMNEIKSNNKHLPWIEEGMYIFAREEKIDAINHQHLEIAPNKWWIFIHLLSIWWALVPQLFFILCDFCRNLWAWYREIVRSIHQSILILYFIQMVFSILWMNQKQIVKMPQVAREITSSDSIHFSELDFVLWFWIIVWHFFSIGNSFCCCIYATNLNGLVLHIDIISNGIKSQIVLSIQRKYMH